MKNRWPRHELTEHPMEPALQTIWPAAQHAIDDFLPPSLRRAPTTGPVRPRPSPRPPLRSREEATAAHRAALAASMLSRRLMGGAVGRKAEQWEAVAASHRGPMKVSRPASARPALTKPPSAARKAPASSRSSCDDSRVRYHETRLPLALSQEPQYGDALLAQPLADGPQYGDDMLLRARASADDASGPASDSSTSDVVTAAAPTAPRIAAPEAPRRDAADSTADTSAVAAAAPGGGATDDTAADMEAQSTGNDFDDVILAAARRAEYIAQCLEADRLRATRQLLEADSARTKALSSDARNLLRPSIRPPPSAATAAEHPPPSPTPLSDAWRKRPLSAPRGAMTIRESATSCVSKDEVRQFLLSPAAANAAGTASAAQEAQDDAASDACSQSLREESAVAAMRWSMEAVALRETASDAGLSQRAPERTTKPSAADQESLVQDQSTDAVQTFPQPLSEQRPMPKAPGFPDALTEVAFHQPEPSLAVEQTESATDDGALPNADPAPSPPTVPPPPPGIRFAWSHPQRLLAGLATAEFSWGPEEQRLLEEYVDQAMRVFDSPQHPSEAEDDSSHEIGDGIDEVDDGMLDQLFGGDVANGASADANYATPPPRHHRPLSSIRGPLPEDPSSAPPSWVARLAMGEREREQRDLNRRLQDFADQVAVEPAPPRPKSRSRGTDPFRKPSQKEVIEQITATFNDEQGFAALVAQIDNDVKAGRELSANRKALQRAMAISAEVADGKLLSSEDMSALQCAFCDSLRYSAPSTAPPFSRATASRPFLALSSFERRALPHRD